MKCRPETRLAILWVCAFEQRAGCRKVQPHSTGGGAGRRRADFAPRGLAAGRSRHPTPYSTGGGGPGRQLRPQHGTGRGRGYNTARKAWAPAPEVSGMSPRSCADTANELNVFPPNLDSEPLC